MQKFLFTILVLLSSQLINGQSLDKLIKKTFDFSPHELSAEEQQKMFPKLDKFFEKVIANKEEYIQPLRDELQSTGNNPYFYFDGGILLLELSKEPTDLQIVADALVKSDLNDLPPKMYLEHLLLLSIDGADVINSALHIFDEPSFQVFIPQHVLLLNQGESLKFILPRYSSDLYVGKLIKRFDSVDSLSTKNQILDLLFYAGNCEADNFIISINDDENQPDIIRSFASEIMKIKVGRRKINQEKESKTRDQIRSTLTRISDEALHELADLTIELKSSYICD